MNTLSLATTSYLVGGAFALLALPALVMPGAWRSFMAAFPRSTLAAWILTGIDIGAVAWIVFHATLGRFEPIKPVLYLVAPASFLLLVKFLDELLAPRALGGLLLLAANPALAAARWHDSEYRLVMTTLAYVAVVIGMVLVLSPYRFRQWASFWISSDARCRSGGILFMLLGVAILLLGAKVY